MDKFQGFHGSVIKVKNPNRRKKGAKLNEKQSAQVKRLISIGKIKKQHPVFQSFNVSTTGSFQILTSINGSTQPTREQRDSAKVELKQLQFRWHANVADSTNKLRIIVFQWKPDTVIDAPSSVNEILEVNGGSVTGDPYVFDKAQRSKFNVLYDREMFMNTTDRSYLGGHVVINNTKRSKMLNYVHYTSVTANTGKNHLYMMLLSDSGATSHPGYTFNGVVTFYDAS